MAAQQLPKSYKDLPAINVYGSSKIDGTNRRFALAALFFVIVALYYFQIFGHDYNNLSPSYFIDWRELQFISHLGVLDAVFLIITWLPWFCAVSGFLVFIFSPNPNKRTGRILGIISIAELIIWHYFAFRYSGWDRIFFGGTLEFWLLLFLFALITKLCWQKKERREKGE